MIEETAAYTLFLPAHYRAGVIFSSPHSGRDYPPAFLRATTLDEGTIRSSEDAFVDQLFGAAPGLGAPLLCARAPRAFVDLNRAADELDPALIADLPRSGHNPRISSGLGVIPRVVSNGRAIYRGKIPRLEAEVRLERHWRPYHARLRALIDECMVRFGQVLLIDCHSMPHEAIDGHGPSAQPTPQVVLGDRFGASAAPAIVEEIESAFACEGLCVARNTPFAGAYVTQAYGRPSQGCHAIQVEIDRSLYMDERRVRPNRGFAPLQEALGRVMDRIIDIAEQDKRPLAAE